MGAPCQYLSFASRGFISEELTPWTENGETWRRLAVTFPDDVPSHSSRQTFYIDGDGLIRRHDYIAEVLGSDVTPTSHYTDNHEVFDGITVPTRRRVYLIDSSGLPVPEPLLVSIDIEDVSFS